MKVLITGAESAKGLIITRALGEYGYRVMTAGLSHASPVFYSKYSHKKFVYEDPRLNESNFIDKILRILNQESIEVLMPTHSIETEFIIRSKKQLEAESSAIIPFSDYETYNKVNDKYCLFKTAKRLGIRVPKTIELSYKEQLDHSIDQISLPAVIKLTNRSGNTGLSYVHSKDELVKTYLDTISTYNLSSGNLPIIQEFIPGEGYGTSVLYDEGKLKAIFTHKRLREYPCSGGPSTLRLSVTNKSMEAIAKTLMDDLHWHGIAMLEFKLDDRDGSPVLIEINPRFWGSIFTAIASGVNFPVLLCKVATNQFFGDVLHYHVGVKTRFLLLDLLTFWSYLKKSSDKTTLFKRYLSNGSLFDIERLDDAISTFMYYGYKLHEWARIKNY